MNKKVTFGQVHRLLGKYGYGRIPVEGEHVLFEQKSAGAVLVLRPHRSTEQIDPLTLAAVRLNMDGNGILDEDKFDGALDAVFVGRKKPYTSAAYVSKKVTFGQIHRLLRKVGWVQTPVEGKHVLFEHKPSGGLIVLRPHRLSERVDPMTLGVVQLNLDLRGTLEADKFADALRKIAANGKAKASRAGAKTRQK